MAAMVESASAGQIDRFLDCFTGAALSEVEAARDSLGTERFAESLRASVAGLKGTVLHAGQVEGTVLVTLTLERVFADGNEKQEIRLRRVDDEWKIDQYSSKSRFVPEQRYGSAANR
jgi:hypothetical protein